MPIAVVDMLLLSGLAGKPVNTCPVLCAKPVIDETCKLSVDERGLYPDYAVTMSIAKKAQRGSGNEITGVQVDSDGDITLVATVYSH